MLDITVQSRGHKLKKINGSVSIGFLDSINEEIIMRAAENEFGTILIPERSFMRSTIDLKKREIYAYISTIIYDVILGYMSQKEFMNNIGMFVKDLILQRIDTASSWAEALSTVTVKRKGHSKPLVDTYEMRNSIDLRVNT